MSPHLLWNNVAAVVNFWFSVLQVFTMMLIVVKWFKAEGQSVFLGAVQGLLWPFLAPFAALARRLGLANDAPLFMLLAVLIPAQMMTVYHLRQLAQVAGG